MPTWWWNADEGAAATLICDRVSSVERAQSDTYERFDLLSLLYDQFDPSRNLASDTLPSARARVTENVCKSNVDTVAAIIAKTDVRAVFMTDGADYTQQKTAMQLEWYSAGLAKRAKVSEKGPRVFKDGSVTGTGLGKVFDKHGQIELERTLPGDVIVDEAACRTGEPRELFHRQRVDRDVLKAAFPEHAEAIDAAPYSMSSGSMRWAGYLPMETNEVILIEAWRLPIGRKGHAGYVPGRRVLCIPGTSLEDGEYHRTKFPFAVFRWNPRQTGWYGSGLVEDIMGHQNEINQLNLREGAILDLHAMPTTYVQQQDLKMVSQMERTRIGRVIPYKGLVPPKTETPQGLTNQLSLRREQLKANAYESSGVSRMSAHGQKPAGLDSAVAQREYKDTTTERFALQEKAYERWVLDVHELMIECAKEMGDDAPLVAHPRQPGQEISWADVDMGDVAVMIQAASSLAKTFAGRAQQVIEWAQAGVINGDESRALMQHPDLESAMSLYTAAQNLIDHYIEAILYDDEELVPEPYMNLKMVVWRFQMRYQRCLTERWPEEKLEALRTFIVQAAKMQEMASGGSDAVGPMPMGPGAPPQAPSGPAPTSAFAGGGVTPMAM